MSVIADFSIPAEDFVLGELLEVRPGVKIRLESMIPTGEAVIPYFWVRTPDIEAVKAALEGSPIVEAVHVVDEVQQETLFRVDWTTGVDGFIETITDADAVVLDGEGHGDFWSFQLRFPEYDALSAFFHQARDKEIGIELESIHSPTDDLEVSEFGLTAEQEEALTLALESGYFGVPREITLVDLAEQLDISDSAVSQRIRRGLTKVLSTTIAQATPSR